MTPTLHGRWQTRILLITTLGLPITGVYALFASRTLVPFFLLGYALSFGLVWDLLYDYLQSLRWDRDWPPLLALVAGLWEGSCLFALVQLRLPIGTLPDLPLLPGMSVVIPLDQFWLHYGMVFGSTYLASLGLLQICMPRWRYRGGQWM